MTQVGEVFALSRRKAAPSYNRVAACSLCGMGVFATQDKGMWVRARYVLGIVHDYCAADAGLTGEPVALEKVTEKYLPVFS